MNRLLAIRITILLMLVVLVGRLYQMQLVDTGTDRGYQNSGVTRTVPVRPLRGEIFASDGSTLLAESVPIYNVTIRPASLDQVAPEGSSERVRVFAQLGQVLGITSTLTISPAAVLERDPVIRSDLWQGLSADVMSQLRVVEDGVPFEVVIAPEQRAGALTLLERYHDVVQYKTRRSVSPELPDELRQSVDSTLLELGSSLGITGTLTIAPAARLWDDQALREDVVRLLGPQVIEQAGRPDQYTWATVEIPPEQSMLAFQLSQVYTETLSLTNAIEERVATANIPPYQTLTIKEDVPREIALVLRENAASLPGVVVEQDYRRRYPLSGEIQSISHMLGYIGRIDECSLVRRNPARSWSTGLLESIGYARCYPVVRKQVDPLSLGQPRYLNDDRIGRDGIEFSYENELRGQLGNESVVVDVLGRPISAPQVVRRAENGYNLVLTIDAPFQRQVEQILRNWIDEGERRRLSQSGTFAYRREYQPITSGAAVVTEIKTGRVLAMVSWPAYDNNIWVDTTRMQELQDILTPPPEERTLARLTNRVVSGEYPPGSTIKQFDAAILLEKGAITADTRVFDPGLLLIQNQYVPEITTPFPNAGRRYNGPINVSDALMVSSNVFFMSTVGGNQQNVVNIPEQNRTSPGLRATEFAEGLNWFGFGLPTTIQLAGERRGEVPTPIWKQEYLREQWTVGDTYYMSIGQGYMLVTPLQLLTASTAINNNGTIYRPQVVKAITDSAGNVVQEFAPEVLHQVPVDPQHYAVVRDGMRRSVTEGSSHAARDECAGLTIAGKTGTAEFGPEIIPGEYQTHSWFVGFAPYDDPEIQVVVLSEGTGGLNDGSATIAVPAATQILQAYYGITPPEVLPPTCQQDMPPLPPRIETAPAPVALPRPATEPQR